MCSYPRRWSAEEPIRRNKVILVWRDLEEEEEKFIKILFDQLGIQNLFFGQSGQIDLLAPWGLSLQLFLIFFLLPLGAQLKLTHQTTSLQVQTHLAFSPSTQINRL